MLICFEFSLHFTRFVVQHVVGSRADVNLNGKIIPTHARILIFLLGLDYKLHSKLTLDTKNLSKNSLKKFDIIACRKFIIYFRVSDVLPVSFKVSLISRDVF